jgi:rubrerythrin
MQESIDSTRLGANRTGMQMSPRHAKEMLENSELDSSQSAVGTNGQAIAEMRSEYIRDADPIGSIPPPSTAKGALKSGVKMMTGSRPQAFIDKLAERLAYERGGTRLYDAAITKFRAHEEELKGVTVAELEKIRDQEAGHALLIKECIEQLGADPTAQTPSADLVGVETMGLLQAVTDPRTNLAQTLHAVLAAELVDEAGWETLIALADTMGQKEMVARFREAEEHEQEHIFKVRGWYESLTLETGELM